MTTIERLEAYLKAKQGKNLPAIRYFNGLAEGQPFCNSAGEYKGENLEASLDNFLKSEGF